MAEEMKFFVDEGWVNIIGGCCGTTDEYIARFPALATQGRPHVPAGKAETLCLSGLEQFELTRLKCGSSMWANVAMWPVRVNS